MSVESSGIDAAFARCEVKTREGESVSFGEISTSEEQYRQCTVTVQINEKTVILIFRWTRGWQGTSTVERVNPGSGKVRTRLYTSIVKEMKKLFEADEKARSSD